jgi:hypothetical protein
VRLAQEQRLSLTGPKGLLKQLTKTVLETALNEEMTEHLGYEKHDPHGHPNGRLHHIGIGRHHHRTRVLILIQDHHITVINAATGEVLRDFTLDPTRDHQPTGARKGPKRKKNREPKVGPRLFRCLATPHVVFQDMRMGCLKTSE